MHPFRRLYAKNKFPRDSRARIRILSYLYKKRKGAEAIMYFLLPVRRVWISRYIERFKGGTGPTRYWFYAYRVFRSNTSLSKRKDRDFVKSDRANLHLSRSDRHYRHNSIKSLPIYRFTSKILIIPSSRLILLHLKKISLFQFLIFNSDRRISINVSVIIIILNEK